jgi:glycosyltransferase involved in cell wall biosynthesis
LLAGLIIKMKKYKVAVVTRTKNRKILLRRAIESVLGQTFQDWLMVIVNDGGVKKDVEDLVAEYQDKFKNRYLIVHNETSLGMEAASNIGIKSSDSNYIVVHDDDDSWHPSFLEKCVEFLDKNPNQNTKGVITYSIRILEKIENDKVITESKEPFNTWLQSVSLYRMSASNTFPPISFVYDRRVLDEIGHYRDDLPVLGDWEFNLRFLSKYDIFLIPEELAFYHHRLTITDGVYSNSVVGDDSKHVFYDTLLRNELLRKDLGKNTIGLGYLVNIGKSFEIVHLQISTFENLLNRLKNVTWLKRLVKHFF